MESITKGECPAELDPGSRTQQVSVNLVRSEKPYEAPPKPKYRAFTGTGQTLAGELNPFQWPQRLWFACLVKQAISELPALLYRLRFHPRRHIDSGHPAAFCSSLSRWPMGLHAECCCCQISTVAYFQWEQNDVWSCQWLHQNHAKAITFDRL